MVGRFPSFEQAVQQEEVVSGRLTMRGGQLQLTSHFDCDERTLGSGASEGHVWVASTSILVCCYNTPPHFSSLSSRTNVY